MGHKDGINRVQDRVYSYSTHKYQHKKDNSSKQSGSKVSLVRRSSKFAHKTSNSQNLPPFSDGILVNVFPGSQENGRLASNIKLKTVEHIHKAKKVQNGIAVHSHEGTHQRSLGHVPRPEGCLPTYTNLPRSSEMAQVHGKRSSVRFQLPSLWTVNSTKSVYQGSEGHRVVPSSQRHPHLYVPRRLAHFSTNTSTSRQRYPICDKNSIVSGFHNQRTKVTFDPHSESIVSGGSAGPGFRQSDSVRGASNQHSGMCRSPLSYRHRTSSSLVKGTGSDGQHGGLSSILQTPHAANSTSLPVSFQIHNTSSEQNGSNVRFNQRRTVLVDVQGKHSKRCGIPFSPASTSFDDRCVQDRLGSAHGRSHSQGTLDGERNEGPHQSPRVVGSPQISSSTRILSSTQENIGKVGQFHGGHLYQQARRNKVTDSLSSYKEVNPVGNRTRDSPFSNSHSRGNQYVGGQSVQGSVAEPDGVVPVHSDLPDPLFKERISLDRSLCVQTQSSASGLLLADAGRESASLGRPLHSMGRDGGVRFPSYIPNSQGASENSQGRLSGVVNSPDVAPPVLVSNSVTDGGRSPNIAATKPGSPQDAGIEGPLSRPIQPPLDCLDIIKRRFQEEGFSEKSADLAARGRRESTLKVYSSRLRPFFEWCKQRKIVADRAPIADIADFLRHKFEGGLQASTMRGYLSAIQSIHKGCVDGSHIKDNHFLRFLIEGMANSRPRVRNIWPAWDLMTVLDKLNGSPFEPIQSASLRDTALKTLFLLAVASGRRCSELHALSIGSHLVFSQAGVTMYFRPGFLAKNERSDFSASPLIIPYIAKSKKRAKRLSCPVRALKWYVNKTQIARGSIQQLFITNVKPYRPAAKSTLAGWLVDVISNSGALEDTGTPRAHSVRAYSTSWAFARGLSIKEIINTVSWRTDTTFVKVYLRDVGPRTSNERFATEVLKSRSHKD